MTRCRSPLMARLQEFTEKMSERLLHVAQQPGLYDSDLNHSGAGQDLEEETGKNRGIAISDAGPNRYIQSYLGPLNTHSVRRCCGDHSKYRGLGAAVSIRHLCRAPVQFNQYACRSDHSG